MYALASLKKFVRDHEKLIGKKGANKILIRARAMSEGGLFSGKDLAAIMDDNALVLEYDRIALSDPEHLELGRVAYGEFERKYGQGSAKEEEL